MVFQLPRELCVPGWVEFRGGEGKFMGMVNAGQLLSIYTTRLSMQERGVTNPSAHVKALTRQLVERLSAVEDSEGIEIQISDERTRFVRVSSGEVLAESIGAKC